MATLHWLPSLEPSHVSGMLLQPEQYIHVQNLLSLAFFGTAFGVQQLSIGHALHLTVHCCLVHDLRPITSSLNHRKEGID
mmetsp:Transcript_52204/g.135375  ORF Transcript_52204/g.135375 Transcript_52204/m.135375 type:complete len:80 (-) Transcript_52204:42-281(-)